MRKHVRLCDVPWLDAVLGASADEPEQLRLFWRRDYLEGDLPRYEDERWQVYHMLRQVRQTVYPAVRMVYPTVKILIMDPQDPTWTEDTPTYSKLKWKVCQLEPKIMDDLEIGLRLRANYCREYRIWVVWGDPERLPKEE